MKKIICGIISFFLMVGGFLAGFLTQQPKINNLKKQVELLQKDSRKLEAMISDQQRKFQELRIQHKAFKALQFRKKSEIKEQMTENLVFQYAIKEYLTLLLKNGRDGQKLEKDEITFFESFEKIIDGKNISTSDKVKIRDYIMEHHGCEIKQLKECEYTEIMAELQNKPVQTN